MADAHKVVNLRDRFAVSIIDCRAAAAAYPGDVPAQLGRCIAALPDGFAIAT
jgi:hypothetical protein